MTTHSTEEFNVNVSAELSARLESYAEMVGQSKATIAVNAINNYLNWRIPQARALKDAIAAADRGEFASDEEVDAVFGKYED